MGCLYIALTLTAWTAIAFAYRYTDKKSGNRLWMGAVMGIAVVVGHSVMAAANGVNPLSAPTSQFVIGVVLGVVSVFGLPIFMAAMKRGDLSITWTVLTLSFALSSLLVMVYPGEKPTATGIAGLMVAAAAVVLLGMDMHARNKGPAPFRPQPGWGLFMAIAFLTNAFSMYSYTLAGHFAPDAPTCGSAFLLTFGIVFCVGSLLAALLVKQEGSTAEGLIGGSMTGVLMFFGSLFTVLGMNVQKVPGYVFFPITTGGSTVLVFLLSVVLLGEKPKRYGWEGLIAGAIAIALLGLAAH